MPVRRAECEAWAREPIAPAQDGFGSTQDNPAAAHPAEIHLHIYGEYKYGMGLMVVVIANAMEVAQTLESGADRRR
jgi:hypothetical protein